MDDINNREHDRFNFPPLSWAKIVIKGNSSDDFKMYQLIDISQSGMSFKSHNRIEFQRGTEFYILQIAGTVFKDALVGKVRYLKPLDEFGVDIKVGAEFLEGK